MKKIKLILGAAALAIFILYCLIGLAKKSTQETFCGTVNRFVIVKGEEVVSIVGDDGLALAYQIENVIYPPFILAVGADRRKARLVLGERYQFTVVGARLDVLKRYPSLVREGPCGPQTPT